MKIKTRRVYYIRYTDDNGQLREIQFSSRADAVRFLNRAILDCGKYDARLVSLPA